MTDYPNLEQRLSAAIHLERRPVAVAFRQDVPSGVSKFEGTVPSGCSFWRLAAQGQTFYTVAGDHYNCPIGSYTHNIDLPEDRAQELSQTLTLMGSIGYIKMEEIPGVFRVPHTPVVVVYAPLAESPVDPDAVLVSGRPGRLMLLGEAALAAGVGSQAPLLGRPTCMAIPASMAQGTIVSSGCIGNRMYTDLGEDELYIVIPGRDLVKVVEAAETIASANAQLAEYHRGRRQSLATV
jgi:uncharacterized protein (DUF169 family)